METWLLLLVMSLAVYRLTRLLVADTFPPVLWLRDRLTGGWRALTEPERGAYYAYEGWSPLGRPEGEQEMPLGVRRAYAALGSVQENDGVLERYVHRRRWSPFWLAELLSCPWCASGWIALVVTGGVWAVAGLAMPVLVWLATWAVGALLAGQEWA
jgi:hypothetical protein